MKSVRLGEELEARLRLAAERSGKTESEIIREGLAARCDELMGESLADRISDVIGSVRGDGSGWTRDAGGAYASSLLEARKKRKSRASR